MNLLLRSRPAWVISLLLFSMTFAFSAGFAKTLDLGKRQTRPLSAGVRCKLDGFQLTTFTGERAMVKVPCKYSLADFQCGSYDVAVIASSSAGSDGRFSPNAVTVKIASRVEPEKVRVRTSKAALLQHRSAEAWEVKKGSLDFLDSADYSNGEARLGKNGVFEVSFSTAGVVEISCERGVSFSSRGVPNTLCGNGVTAHELDRAKKQNAMQGEHTDLTMEQYLHYVILRNSDVTQSEKCKELASEFQSCNPKIEDVGMCEAVFGEEAVVCLANQNITPAQAYSMCLKWPCEGDGTGVQELLPCIRDQ